MKYAELLIQPKVMLAKSRDLIEVMCPICNHIFTIKKHQIQSKAAKNAQDCCCSQQCARKCYSNRCCVTDVCGYCGVSIKKSAKIKAASKSGFIFCSSSCSGKYTNAHKSTGTRRSKLECWLELELNKLYPNLHIIYNDKKAINSELDIYLPTLNLAFELNGIFHYEPIYGEDKLKSIQNNDDRKFQACIEQRIELCLIDTHHQINSTTKSNKQFLDIITTIIDSKLS